jgi:hypothetical protein
MLKTLITPVIISCFLVVATPKAFSQSDMDSTAVPVKEKKMSIHNYNFLKTNLTSILLKNYSLQYERTLNRKISFAISFRVMPETGIPFKKLILDAVGDDDPDTKQTIEDFRLSNTAITPEFRFYLSKKGYGRGFYIAPFYRHATFKTNNIDITYDDDNGGEGTLQLSGKLTSNTGGLLFGVQHVFGKVALDIWLLGPHIGSGKGTFTGLSSKPLSSNEQDDIRQNLTDIDIPLTHQTVDVNAGGAKLTLDGPWGGLRSGISLGIRF